MMETPLFCLELDGALSICICSKLLMVGETDPVHSVSNGANRSKRDRCKILLGSGIKFPCGGCGSLMLATLVLILWSTSQYLRVEDEQCAINLNGGKEIWYYLYRIASHDQLARSQSIAQHVCWNRQNWYQRFMERGGEGCFMTKRVKEFVSGKEGKFAIWVGWMLKWKWEGCIRWISRGAQRKVFIQETWIFERDVLLFGSEIIVYLPRCP